MLKYSKYSRIFLAPPDDKGGGGGSPPGNPAAGQGGGQQQQEGSSEFKDPTAGLDLDDLPPEVRTVIEESRKGFAALQKQAADNKQAAAAEEARRKDFQSQYDKLRVHLEALTQSGTIKTDDPEKERLQQFQEILVQEGVPVPQAAIQAKIMLKMMNQFGTALKADIGNDLRPFAATVVTREAESSWQQAVQMDRVGVLQIPELAQHVWNQVSEMAKAGQQVTPQIVQNLAGMAYMTHLQQGGTPAGGNPQPPVQQPQQQQQTQLPNVGRLTYPGAGAQPFQPVIQNQNGARTVLDPDTDAALQTVMKTWAKGQGGVKAPGLREPVKKGGH